MIKFGIIIHGGRRMVAKLSCRPSRHGQMSCSRWLSTRQRWTNSRFLMDPKELFDTEDAAWADMRERDQRRQLVNKIMNAATTLACLIDQLDDPTAQEVYNEIDKPWRAAHAGNKWNGRTWVLADTDLLQGLKTRLASFDIEHEDS